MDAATLSKSQAIIMAHPSHTIGRFYKFSSAGSPPWAAMFTLMAFSAA